MDHAQTFAGWLAEAIVEVANGYRPKLLFMLILFTPYALSIGT